MVTSDVTIPIVNRQVPDAENWNFPNTMGRWLSGNIISGGTQAASGVPDLDVTVAACEWLDTNNLTHTTTTSTVVTMDAAEAVNWRIDIIEAKADGTIDKVTGTPHATDPQVPSLTSGAVLLAIIKRTALDDTIADTDIYDCRDMPVRIKVATAMSMKSWAIGDHGAHPYDDALVQIDLTITSPNGGILGALVEGDVTAGNLKPVVYSPYSGGDSYVWLNEGDSAPTGTNATAGLGRNKYSPGGGAHVVYKGGGPVFEGAGAYIVRVGAASFTNASNIFLMVIYADV